MEHDSMEVWFTQF